MPASSRNRTRHRGVDAPTQKPSMVIGWQLQPSAVSRSVTPPYDRKNVRQRFGLGDDGVSDLGGFLPTPIASRRPSSAIVQFYEQMRPRAPAHEAKYEPMRPKLSSLASVRRYPRCASRASGYRPGRA